MNPRNMGLLGLGANLLRPGASLGDGFAGFQSGLMQGEQLLGQQLHRQAQAENLQAQAEERQAGIRAGQKQQEAMRQLMGQLRGPADSPSSQPAQGAVQGVSGGMVDPLAQMAKQSRKQWTPEMVQLALASGYKPDQIQLLAGASDLGMPEVARTIDSTDSMGRPQTTQFDKFGRPVGEAFAKPYEKKLVDRGGFQQYSDPYMASMVGNQFEKTNSPDSVLSAETTRRGQNMTDSRAREFNATQREMASVAGEAATAKRQVDIEMKLSDDYDKISRDFRQIYPAVQKIRAALPFATKSAPATLAAATSFMKLLDPGSVVRESELGMALAASGVLDRLGNYVNTLANGKVLTSNQVKEFEMVVDQVYEGARQAQELTDKGFAERAKRYGARPDMVVSGVTAASTREAPKQRPGLDSFDMSSKGANRPALDSFER